MTFLEAGLRLRPRSQVSFELTANQSTSNLDRDIFSITGSVRYLVETVIKDLNRTKHQVLSARDRTVVKIIYRRDLTVTDSKKRGTLRRFSEEFTRETVAKSYQFDPVQY